MYISRENSIVLVPSSGFVGIYLNLDVLILSFRVVVDNYLQRIKHSHGAFGILIEIVPYA